MKYPKLTAFLGIMAVNIHSGLFGAKAHARLDEESLQKLEDHLSEKGGEDIQQKLDNLQEKYNTLETANSSMKNAVTQALELNGLSAELSENATEADAVVLLGNKCKEYGAADNRHSFPKNDGQEKEEESDPSNDYQHNKIMTQQFNFPKIKE